MGIPVRIHSYLGNPSTLGIIHVSQLGLRYLALDVVEIMAYYFPPIKSKREVEEYTDASDNA